MPLGLWIFLFMIDSAGPKSNPETLGSIITQPKNARKKIEKGKKKWIDDFTLLASIDLKKCLVPFTKHPLFQRNRLTCSGNPTFESCVEVKAQQR